MRPAAGTRKPARGTHGLVPNKRYRSAKPTTVEMARRVLKNEGAPMTPKQIGEKIFSTFGFKPAKSLYQMLYKRAKAKKGFTMDGAGKYGLEAL